MPKEGNEQFWKKEVMHLIMYHFPLKFLLLMAQVRHPAYSNNYLSLRIVATIDAPWIGGFEYMGLITSFSWLSTLLATSAVLQTYKEYNWY